ncbi:hypothetical protein ACWEDF_06315 [Micromonospora chersina]
MLAERIDGRHDPGIPPKITSAIMWTGNSYRGICTCRMNELITRPPPAISGLRIGSADARCPIPDHEQLVGRGGAWAALPGPAREQRRRTP